MPLTLSVDETKVRAYVELEKKAAQLKAERDAAEKRAQNANETYANLLHGARQGMNSWDAVGPAHVASLKAQSELDRLSAASSAAAGDLQNAKPVLVEECLRVARTTLGGA